MAKQVGRFNYKNKTLSLIGEDTRVVLTKEAITTMADLLPDTFFSDVVHNYNNALIENGENQITEEEFNFVKEQVFNMTGTKKSTDSDRWK
jgi:hypothetical protein